LSIENLRYNKSLVNFMDDNLAIHLSDYLTNPLIELKNYKKDELIEVEEINPGYQEKRKVYF
jgi:hypothetical protein